MHIINIKPLNHIEILVKALRLYKDNFWTTISYALPAALFFCAPAYFTGSHLSLVEKWEIHPFLVATIIIGWILGIVFQAALIFRLHCIRNQSPCRWISALNESFYKIFSLLLLTALYILMVLSGTMLIIVPGFILAISLMFSFILVITERHPVLQNLTISHELVWGHWWYTVSIFAFVSLLHLCAYMILFLGLFEYSIHLINIGTAQFLFSCGNIIIQTILIPFSLSVGLILLEDLRSRYPMRMRRL